MSLVVFLVLTAEAGWISDAYAYTINEFAIPTANSQPDGITKGPDGNIWFTEAFSGKIGRITTTGIITEFSASAGFLYSITAGPDGNLWFTDSNNAVGRITTSGEVTLFPVPTASGGLYGITAGPDGNLWFAENGVNKIGRITTTGVVTEFPLPAGGGPYGITAGSDGNLWFTGCGGGGIGQITTAGFVTCFPAPYGGNMITTGPDGNLWISGGGGIVRMTTTGVSTLFPFPNTTDYARGITAGPDGNLWFTLDDSIGRITPAGTINKFLIPTGSVAGSYDITSGPDGNIWFTESVGNKIGQIVLSTVQPAALADTTPPTTTASPAGGTYSSAQSVTLSCNDGTGSGCDKIYYTTDGSDPTMLSSVYTTPIKISDATILKFFAQDRAGNSETPNSSNIYIITSGGTGNAITISSPLKWIETSLNEPLNNNGYMSGAVDLNGKIHIVYTVGDVSNANTTLKYKTNISGSWQTYNIDSNSYECSVAVDSNNKVHIAYIDYMTNGNGYILKYATNKSGAWENSLIDNNISHNPKIVIGKDDTIHIAYQSDLSDGKKIMHASKQSTTWQVERVDPSAGDQGSPSIAVDSLGNVYLSYCTGGYTPLTSFSWHYLKYAKKINGVWSPDNVDTIKYYGSFDTNGYNNTSIAVDQNNNVHIVYIGNQNPGEVWYSTNKSGAWSSVLLTVNGSNPSIVIDNKNNVHMSLNGVKYLTNEAGNWSISDVDYGYYSSMAIDSNSDLYAFYVNSGGIAYATSSILDFTLMLNGTCGSSSGVFFFVAPSNNLCTSGNASSIGGSGPWSWSCSGSNGGSTVSCSAFKTTPPTTPVVIATPPIVNFAGAKTGTTFTILRSVGGSSFVQVASGPSTTFTDNSVLKPNTIYTYVVTSDTDPTQTTLMTIRTPLYNGWNIVAVPYQTTGVNPATFFASPVSAIYQWIPSGATPESSNSVLGSYTMVSAFTPGYGYYVKASNSSTLLSYSGTAGPASATVTLKPGWTMIANPNTTNKTNIGTTWLIDGSTQLSTAIGSGKIGSSLYWWNGTTYDFWTVASNPQVEPWKAYWILNLDNINHSLTIQ
jgi:virginiamycin B lyase